MPFGETFVEEKSSGSFSNPYKFSGKELDRNTGFYLFGARYYNPKTSLWLSLDPLAELFPSVGGYVYSYNNPVMFSDPSGLEPDPNGDADCPTCKTKKTENVHGTLENPVELQEVVFKKKKEASTAQKVGEFAIGFVPIVGSVYDIYEGAKNGDNLQLALGVGGLLLDVATLGSGSLLKGGLKQVLKSSSKGIGLELAGVQVTKNALKNSTDDVAKVGLYSATTGAAKNLDDVYDIAKNGGKHNGFYKQYIGKTKAEIEKGIKSLQKQIDEHLDKISNPEKYIPDFKKLDPRQQKALIEKKWLGDIARQKEQKQILKNILKNK